MASFFQLQKNKRFAFKPRYYNEMEEKRKEREERIKKEIEAEKLGVARDPKVDLANYIKIARNTKKKSNVRLLVILLLLLVIFYFFLIK